MGPNLGDMIIAGAVSRKRIHVNVGFSLWSNNLLKSHLFYAKKASKGGRRDNGTAKEERKGSPKRTHLLHPRRRLHQTRRRALPKTKPAVQTEGNNL